MKVLVTGAGGYIGSQTCKTLFKKGYHVVGVDRNKIKHGYCKTVYSGDYRDYAVQALLLDIDCVVHIGATSLVGPSVLDPSKYYNNNVASTLELLDACKNQNVNVLYLQAVRQLMVSQRKMYVENQKYMNL